MARILVVDDQPIIRIHFAQDLAEEGYHVWLATNAAEAIALISSGTMFDLVVTDVDMPGAYNGLELAEFVKDVAPRTKVIVISGGAHEREGMQAIDGFLQKPTTSRALRRHVAQALESATPVYP